MSNPLIHQLSNDLKPCCPCSPYSTNLMVMMIAAVAAVLMLICIGLRPDLNHAVTTLMPYWKSGMFALIGVGALISSTRLGFPGRGIGMWGPALMIFGTTSMVAFIAGAFCFGRSPQVELSSLFLSGRHFCLSIVFSLGLLLLVIEFFILRRLAFTRPRLAGGLIGVASGSFAAATYAWHCVNDQPLFVGAWYSIPVLTLAGLGALIGKRFLRM